MRRGSFKSRLPRHRHCRYNYIHNHITPALLGLSLLSVLLISAFALHILPGLSGQPAAAVQNDHDMLKVAAADDGLVATVSPLQKDAMTEVQVENMGSAYFKRVKVMAGGGRTLGILSQLAPDEKKILAAKGNLKDVEITAVDSHDRVVSGEVRYIKPDEPSPDLESSASPPAKGSSSPQVHLSTQAADEQPGSIDEQPKSAESDQAANDSSPRFNIVITTNRSSAREGDVVEYVCDAVNCGSVNLSDVKLFCGGNVTSTTCLTPGMDVSLVGTIAISNSLNLSAGVQGLDADGRLWTNNASATVLKISPRLSLRAIAPEKVHRGQSTDLNIEVANAGEGSITNLTIFDAFGEIGRVPLLEQGESSSLQRNLIPERSMEDLVEARGTDALGRDISASENFDLGVFTSGLEIVPDRSELVSYRDQPANVTWTLRNTGEEALTSVTLDCDGSMYRLMGLSPGSSTKMQVVYIKDGTSRINITAEGCDSTGRFVNDTGSVLIKTISPGIGLKIVPSEIEASNGEVVNLSCLVTNTGDDLLTNIVLLQNGELLGAIDPLSPGEFRTIHLRQAIGSNAVFDFSIEGVDSLGRIWSDSVPFTASIITYALRASASASTLGDTALITCTVANSGCTDLYNIFILSRTFGTLGTIDYLPSKGQRSIMVKVPAPSSETNDLIAVEAFTSDRQPVRSQCQLHITGSTHPGNQSLSNTQEPASVPGKGSVVKPTSTRTATASGKDLLSGVEGLIRYIEGMLGHAGAGVGSSYDSIKDDANINKADSGNNENININNSINYGVNTSLAGYSRTINASGEIESEPDASAEAGASREYELSIASVKGSDHGAIRILDVSASPPQPAAGQSVKLSVHAKSTNPIKSVKATWGLSDAPLTKQGMMDVDRIQSMPMTIESGDDQDGYWSCTIPGRTPGTYMVISTVLADGSSSVEDGPYMLHWSTVNSGSVQSAQPSGKGMLFIESSVVNGNGGVSIKDSFEDSAVHFNEKMKGAGSINLESERQMDKSSPNTNFVEKKDLVFTGGSIKGSKSLESPSFHGGMGAKVTERYNLSHVDKSDSDMLSTNYTYNTLTFNTDQAFEGNWSIQTQYAKFYQKLKTDQTYTGSFQTEKKIKFQDH
jgi:hypothetical protein